MPAVKSDYRERLYGSYVEGQMSSIRDISLRGIKRDFPIFKNTVGPFLPADHEANILDVGCGYGALVSYLHQTGYRNASGIDASPQMVDSAFHLGIKGIKLDDVAVHLSNVYDHYSMIVALDVIEHFRKDEILPILDLIHQAVRPGGLFLMQTPNGMSKYGRWYQFDDFTHEVIFDSRSAQQCLRAAGFRNTKVVPLSPVVHGAASAIRAALWTLWLPWLKMSMAVECGWQSGQVFTPNLIAVGVKEPNDQRK